MSQKVGKNNNKVYRLVLTGGPCGGKTTGQARLCSFFETLGWKVYRVPESATVLLGGGVKFTDLNEDEVYKFQENLIKTMMQMEDTFFDLASTCSRNCLVICDRGIMDATAYMKSEQWDHMKKDNNWNDVEMRDQRYNQVIHMVSAAKGAEIFYSSNSNNVRVENIELARQLDNLAAQAWVGHPYYDVIDNTTDFESKLVRMISMICNRLGINAGDRLSQDSKKRKFLVRCLPDELGMLGGQISVSFPNAKDESGIEVLNAYPQFQDFIVVHDYLVTPNSCMQARIRRRGQNVQWDKETNSWKLTTGHWTYTHTIRRPEINKKGIETKMQISSREYSLLLAQRDQAQYTIFKKRRCFLWNNQYFQMDIYQKPCHPRCEGLILLETYTTIKGNLLQLPDFLSIEKEVTNDRTFSMYNLSRKDTPKLKPSDSLPIIENLNLKENTSSKDKEMPENNSAPVNGTS